MEQEIIKILIYCHAFLGSIALFSGFVSLVAKKGNSKHKKAGKMFYYSMLSAALIALIISVLPKHESSFLFSIGIFSSYFILTGYRALRFKNKNLNLKTDKIISWTMIITATLMLFYEPLLHQKINIVQTTFGIIGLCFSIRDLVLYKDINKLKTVWLKSHLGKMTGAYIIAVTAFVIVNDFFASFYGWFIPGTIGGFYIIYWIKKTNRKQKQTALSLE